MQQTAEINVRKRVMMRQYSRKLPLWILLTAGALGGAYVYAHYVQRGGTAVQTVAGLEEIIATDRATDDTWLAYGEALRAQGRFEPAATAYRKVIENQADARAARIGLTLALAQGENTEALYAHLRDLVYGDPKLALELFLRPECQRYLNAERFAALLREARIQVMD